MIIDEHKTIFIHIPKNAGTSITHYFFKNTNIGLVEYGIRKHDTVHDVKIKLQDYRRFYNKFAVVRNPYSRMVSWYSFLKLWAKSTEKPVNIDFNQWIKNPIKESYKQKDWLNVHEDLLLKPQCDWIDETVVILKYENLKKELNKFFGKKINLPIVNKTKHKHYLKYYDKESLNIVYDRFKEDFKKFNYKKL